MQRGLLLPILAILVLTGLVAFTMANPTVAPGSAEGGGHGAPGASEPAHGPAGSDPGHGPAGSDPGHGAPASDAAHPEASAPAHSPGAESAPAHEDPAATGSAPSAAPH